MGYQLFVGGTIAAKRIKTDTSDDNDCKLKLSIDFSLMSARVAGGTHVSQSCFVPGEQRSIRRGDKADEEDKKKTEEEAKKKAAEEAKQPLWEYDPDGSGTWMPFKDDCQSYIESKYQLFAGGTIAAKRMK